MSKKIVYECAKCDCVAILHMRDGQCCPHCGGYMNATREANPGEFVGVQREPIEKKTATISEKLEYLDRLNDIYRAQTNPIMADTIERMTKVCNSIERDLGIGADVAPDGGIVGTGTDIKEFIEKWKNGYNGGVIKTNETIVIGGKDKEEVVPTHAVTGMYKREWSDKFDIDNGIKIEPHPNDEHE